MFTAIIGIGIGNILLRFAGMTSRLKSLKGRYLGVIWLLILLISLLSMFWNSGLIAQRDSWTFALFLYVVSGPVVLLLACNLMATLLEDNAPDDVPMTALEESVLTRFFLLFALAQAWTVGMEQLLGIDWSYFTTITALLTLCAFLLALIKNMRLRWAFTLTVAGLRFGDIIAQSLSA